MKNSNDYIGKKMLTLQNLFKNTTQRLYAIVILLILYASIISTLNFLNSSKVGYIDSSILMEKYPPAITAREEFQRKSLTWKENVKTLESELMQMNKELIESSNHFSKKDIQEKQEAIKKKQNDYANYSKAINEKAVELEKELFEHVFTELNNRINDFGKENGYEIIFGTLTGGNILYGSNNNDLTEEFLSYASN